MTASEVHGEGVLLGVVAAWPMRRIDQRLSCTVDPMAIRYAVIGVILAIALLAIAFGPQIDERFGTRQPLSGFFRWPDKTRTKGVVLLVARHARVIRCRRAAFAVGTGVSQPAGAVPAPAVRPRRLGVRACGPGRPAPSRASTRDPRVPGR